MHGVQRRILEDEEAGRPVDAQPNEVENVGLRVAEPLVVGERTFHVVGPADREEVVLLVVIERRLLAQAAEDRIGIRVDLEVVRVVIDVGSPRPHRRGG